MPAKANTVIVGVLVTLGAALFYYCAVLYPKENVAQARPASPTVSAPQPDQAKAVSPAVCDPESQPAKPTPAAAAAAPTSSAAPATSESKPRPRSGAT